MANPERAARRRRDIGLAKVGRWTRYSIATGVVLSGVLGAGVAHALPGQSQSAPKKDTPQAQPAAGGPAAQAPVTTQQSPVAAPSPAGHNGDNGHKKTTKRLRPPTTAPSPSPTQTQHATSGGS